MDYRSTPSVLIDLDIVERNISNAVKSLGEYAIAHRPHIKVHKSVYLAKKQIEMGCKGITCAKLGEAEVMADGGISDILVAFPLIGADKLARYRGLVERGIQIRTIINSIPGAKGLSRLGEEMGTRLKVLIELDGGINRGGVRLGPELIEFAKAVKSLPGLEIEGVEYYGGDIYALSTERDICTRSKKEADDLVSATDSLREICLPIRILSGGSSFSLQYPAQLKGLTEARAGNYIFNDGARLSIGSISADDCAMRILSTVVSRPDKNSAIIDAGSKTLTSDRVGGWDSYGYIIEAPHTSIWKLNEEHGFLRSEKGIDFEIGDVISIIPNHACVVPNLCDEVYGVRAGKLETIIKIDARGKTR